MPCNESFPAPPVTLIPRTALGAAPIVKPPVDAAASTVKISDAREPVISSD